MILVIYLLLGLIIGIVMRLTNVTDPQPLWAWIMMPIIWPIVLLVWLIILSDKIRL